MTHPVLFVAVGALAILLVLACVVGTVVLVVEVVRSGRARDRALAECKAVVEGRHQP